ncbi:MAG: class I SAM-dependent methyltransferase [Candidatus Nealsonbacteria bacterium]|nr:class I SAM-dependent methyltransferase [Candidatus Nealsonbacteria bacterium]
MTATPEYWHSEKTPWDFPLLRTCVDSLTQHMHPGMRVLDVGCGNGFWANRFSKQGCEVVGIDPSRKGVKKARLAYPAIRFEQLEAGPDVLSELAEDPFDLVVSFEVIEHCYGPMTWASGCFNALKAPGTFICSTPYHGYLKNLAISIVNKWDWHWFPIREGGHIKFWSRATLGRLLAETGFDRGHIQFRGAGRLPFLWKTMVVKAVKQEHSTM